MKILKTLQIGILLLFCAFNSAFAQIFTNSNLPIVLINTDKDPSTNEPALILDDPRVLAKMRIIKHTDGSRNYLSDTLNTAYLNYNGRINIEIRGSSSQYLPKKGYGLTTLKADNASNNNVSLLGMPSENDWILNPLAYDKSLIRDYIAYNLFSQMGNYSSRCFYCEVIVNGSYKGLYLLQEKLKADGNRINVAKITNADNTLPNITGGYITKCDKTTGGDPVAWTMISGNGDIIDFIHSLPKPEDVTTQQNQYIQNEFTKLEATARNNSSLLNGYPTVIDIPSFVDFMLTNEYASNVDAYRFSTFFHKDRGGKLRAGPIWDFNFSFGFDIYGNRSQTRGWQFNNGDNEGAKFWKNLFNNPIFKCYLSKRWNELIKPSKPFNYNEITTFIDVTVANISEAVGRENSKWNTIQNHPAEIAELKSFIEGRVNWVTNNIGENVICATIETPPLVINKINYNPATSTSFPVSNDQEFIEIKNTGTNTINLSGIYLSELGLSYQFPYNATVDANQSVFIASNSAVFQSKYGISASGQFVRNLSNKSQKIILADAFGNVIDKVEYFDSAPWPLSADGLGSYLKLINTSLDNNVGTSWEAADLTDLLADNPLPLKIIDFNAKNIATGNVVSWSFTSNKNVKSISVLRKNNLGFFENISPLLPPNATSFIDNNPINGDNYYQLSAIEDNGQVIIYPNIASVKGLSSPIMFYPNPVINGMLNIKLNKENVKSVSIFNLLGKKVFFKNVLSKDKTLTINIGPLAKGLYIVELVGVDFLLANKLLVE